MTNEYQPPTVAVATVGGKTQRIFRTEDEWCDEAGNGREGCEVAHVRRLVVLDPKVDIQPAFSIDWLRSAADTVARAHEYESSCVKMLRSLADQIEAQTKPPRIPEPGLWGVVEAHTRWNSERGHYVRSDLDGSVEWLRADGRSRTLWSELIDPVLIREGVES